MPDRRHLWRGIHDPEMVKAGVRIDLDVAPPGADGTLAATLAITSVGVGHFFPTYVTPRVVARLALVDDAGRVVDGSVEERAIGRAVTLDLTREIEDTRIPPGGRAELAYRRRVDGAAALRLRATVTVYPDHFYTGFFEALLASGPSAGETRLREALAETRRSPFVLFARDVPIDGARAPR